ncbi:hypothetical protein EGT07_23760 [Herbaspirillum sp. HC18]|nr:hypothetical protein EGT07_23760 [Herbaspirillum sp. HC18]
MIQRILPLFDNGIQRYSALPQAVRYSLLPVVIASLPLVVSSMFGAYWTIPIVIALTAVLLYFTALETDKFMFQLSKVRAHIAITMPLCGFISLWGIALALADRKGIMLGVVGPYSLLLLIACAPAYRWSQARKARRIPLHFSFPAIGAVVLAGSFAYV